MHFNKLPARLVLEDGTIFTGESFGATRCCSGEVIFNTSMFGFCETLTDPTFAGQILTLTWPLIGNCGVPPQTEDRGVRQFFESNRIWPRGLVVSEYSEKYSHWHAVRSLADWLKEENIPALTGVDTRAIAKHLREKGTMLGTIEIAGEDEMAVAAGNSKTATDSAAKDDTDPRKTNLFSTVSCKEIIEYEPNADEIGNKKSVPRVVLVDCGTKNSVIRNLLKRGAKVIRVPWNHDFTAMDYDGVVISNGPGDPGFASETVANVKKALDRGKPIFGICMGNLILGKAAGAGTFRLRFGHHSSNQPVQLCGTDRTHVTPQNHGFAIDPLRLSDGWEQWFINLNDGTCAGLRHKTKPFFSVQFHPENCGGPKNSENIYDLFFTKISAT